MLKSDASFFHFTMGSPIYQFASLLGKEQTSRHNLPQLPETKAKKLRKKGEGGNLLCSFGKLFRKSTRWDLQGNDENPILAIGGCQRFRRIRACFFSTRFLWMQFYDSKRIGPQPFFWEVRVEPCLQLPKVSQHFLPVTNSKVGVDEVPFGTFNGICSEGFLLVSGSIVYSSWTLRNEGRYGQIFNDLSRGSPQNVV